MDSDEGDDLVGQVLCGTYKVERQIGEGGMGAVYEASHVRLPRKFAIKMLHSDALANEEVFHRFRREAEIASSIGHDNIAQVYDFNHTEADVPFMVLEYLEGEDLEQRLERVGRLTLAETASLLKQVASGLEAAHAVDVVHRDLKPPNLFLCERPGEAERVKILDFGISKSINSTSMVTRTGSVMGSPNFMSPEQADGDVGDIDARTDVFALGCILFHCLTGEYAFEGPTVMGTLYKIVHGKPADLKSLAPELPKGVRAAIMRALDKKQASRTQSVSELRDEFLAACPADLLVAPLVVADDDAGPRAVPVSRKSASGQKRNVGTITAIIDGSRRRRGVVAMCAMGVVAASVALLLLKSSSAEAVDIPQQSEPAPVTKALAAPVEPEAKPSPELKAVAAQEVSAVQEPAGSEVETATAGEPAEPAVEDKPAPPTKAKISARRVRRPRKKTPEAPPADAPEEEKEPEQEFWGPLSGR